MMKPFNFYIPTRIVFGEKQVENLDNFIPEGIKRLLIVTDKTITEKTNIIQRIKKLIHCEVVIFNDVDENPSLDSIRIGSEFAREKNVDLVIGIGGGSSMDAAKGIALLCKNEGLLLEYINGRTIDNLPLPIICIPTTSGTGSEVTPYAVFTDPEQEIKTAISHYTLFPQTSIIDPELTYSMPESVIVNTGLDALSHSVEAFLSTESFALNNDLAMKSIEIILANLPNAMTGNHDAMGKMAYASMLGGIAIAHASTILPHIMAYPLTVYHKIPHGKANAILLPEFLNYMILHSTVKEKVNELLEPFKSVGGIENFINSLGVSTKLSDYAIHETEFNLFAEKTIVKGDVKITPAKVTIESIVSIYKAAF